MDVLADLIGDSPGIVAVREKLGRLLQHQSEARRFPPILIQGETGTGKGLLARLIHEASPRAAAPFVDINCAAIPETLLEAEMFGFERGAFTDARQAKPGLFQTAHHGTIFLDEVGLLPEGVQAKLLKAIEERAVRRLGSTRAEPVDAAVIAATSEDLAAAMRARRFREDLYHRLAVMTVSLPPLRERGADILRLGEHFLARACQDYRLPLKSFTADARAALLAYRWPGNLRELGNVMERVALLSEGRTVTVPMLALPSGPTAEPAGLRVGQSLHDAVRSVEREALVEALRAASGNISRAAARLGLSRNTLRYRLEKHGLGPRGVAPPSRAPSARRHAPAAGPARRAGPAATPPGDDAASGERRPVLLLRAALVAPPGASPGDLTRALEALDEKVRSFGGRVEALDGRGLEATFGLEPIEDAPSRAAHAAIAMQRAVERDAAGAPLGLRIGIHTAQLAIRQESGRIAIVPESREEPAALLSALVERAEGGTILVSEATAPLLERRFDLVRVTPAGETAGAVYRLAGREGTGSELRRRLATFVGRRHELELLQSRLASAMTGRGQVVGIAGEAGIGKTRLLFEFQRSLAGRRVTYLEGHCRAYGDGIPYLPLLDLLRNNCGITDTDTPEAIVDKVRAGLQVVGLDPAEGAPYLLQLLGVKEETGPLALLSPEAIKGRTFETLRQMALKGSRQRPLILAVENLHWVDRTSEEYLGSLVESLAGAPLLLLLTYRPGYRPPGIEKSYATQIALQPLAAPDSLSLVRSFLQTEELPPAVADAVLGRAEGNPFFLEELALSLWEQSEPGATAAVPGTIQEALMARINRLPDEPKRVLQTASILGREFSLRLLGAIWPGPGGLDPHLVELKRLEFLYERSSSDEPVYVFKHTLTQEVAYESLPPVRRRALHAATGRALERLHAGRRAAVADQLAHHYARTDESEKALEYLGQVAEQAARSYAHAEAVRALGEALPHVDRLPAPARDRHGVEVALRQAHSLYFLGRFAECLELLLGQLPRVEGLQDPTLAGPYYFRLGHTQSHLGAHDEAARSAERALREATQAGDEATAGRAHYVLARSAFWSGSYARAAEHGRHAIALLERTAERWWLGAAHWGMAFTCGFTGEFTEALAAAARADAIGQAIADPRLQAYAAWTTGWIRAAMGDGEAGIEACRRSLERSPDAVNTADATSFLGYAHVANGDAGRAIPLLRQAVEQWRLFRHRPMLGWFTSVLAEAHRLEGQLERARELASEALGLTGEAGFRYGLGLAQRALGRVARASGAPAGAEPHLAEALATFGHIGARYDEALTDLDLADLANALGNPQAAGRHVGRAYAAFSSLGIPHHAARAAELASRLGVPLPPPAAA